VLDNFTAPDRPLDVLIVAPHPDDAELGMGGAILKMRSEGWNVGILDLTTGEPTPHGSLELRKAETDAASRVLDVSWRYNAGLVNRSLEPTLDAREKIASIIRLTQPRWLFAPYWEDAHPDHVAATALVEAARFWAKLSKTDMPGNRHHPERIYYYFCIHLRLAVQPAFILDISPFWEKKLEAIRCFESQFITGRPTESPTMLDRFRDDAAYWGRLIGRGYGEPFATREPLALDSMQNLF
jgi:N-acetylglucosamine malate deacetylase 1